VIIINCQGKVGGLAAMMEYEPIIGSEEARGYNACYCWMT